jgi:hypothetical protein
MRDLRGIDILNARTASRELAELRADTVKGLRHAFATGDVDAVRQLLAEAGVLGPLFAQHDCLKPGEETIFPEDRG